MLSFRAIQNPKDGITFTKECKQLTTPPLFDVKYTGSGVPISEPEAHNIGV